MAPADTPARRELIERITRLYDRASGWPSVSSSRTSSNIQAALRGDLPSLERTLARLKPKSVAGSHWAGFALASAINLHRDDMERVGELPKALALLERAHALDPDLFQGASALALGVAYASLCAGRWRQAGVLQADLRGGHRARPTATTSWRG